jgi:hypothetical protein
MDANKHEDRRTADIREGGLTDHPIGGALHSAKPAQAQVEASARMQVLRLERCDAPPVGLSPITVHVPSPIS